MSSGQAFPYIEVAGTAYAMGVQHGAQAAALISRYLLLIERVTQLPRAVLARNAMRFVPLIEALNPRYLEEVHGLAHGAGISFEEAMICQARAEAAYDYDGGCTAFALTGAATRAGQTLAGQNQDLPPEYSDVGIVLHVQPTDGRPRAVMFTFAGQLGYMGLNSEGVALFANALYDYAWQLGLPKYAMKRTILEQGSVAEAVGLLEQHRLCSANNLVLADRSGAVADVEVRPEGVAHFTVGGAAARVHTNHYATPEFAALETHTLPDSCARLDRMNALLRAQWGQVTVESLQALLADHDGEPGGICRHGANGYHTISGYIAEPGRGVLHVRRGHGCLGTWNSYVV
jgi:isopenicillin-N N-acyltransferase like protein